jgi:hypothetical protein
MGEGDGKMEVRVRVSLLPGGFKANDVTERQLCGFVYFLLCITVKLVRRGWACLVQYGSFVRKLSFPYVRSWYAVSLLHLILSNVQVPSPTMFC